uniref:lysine--tRNA ligase-like isoform X2 n=1 Tax=Erigeron canadensis TaxID=72917 RepID=UPI001CB944DD|nr:lysine--tRNA ligase-like isoform X2 [Erigeron canadensis]
MLNPKKRVRQGKSMVNRPNKKIRKVNANTCSSAITNNQPRVTQKLSVAEKLKMMGLENIKLADFRRMEEDMHREHVKHFMNNLPKSFKIPILVDDQHLDPTVRQGKSLVNPRELIRRVKPVTNGQPRLTKRVSLFGSLMKMGIDNKTIDEMIKKCEEKFLEEIGANKPIPEPFKIRILEDDQDLDPSQYHQKRLNTIADRKATQGILYDRLVISLTTPIPVFIDKYKNLKTCRAGGSRRTYLAGRLMRKVYSPDVITYDLVGFGGQVLVEAFPTYAHDTNNRFHELHSDLRVGDYVGVVGFPANSSAGDLSIRVCTIKRLSYCLRRMPPMLPVMKEFDALTPESGGNPNSYILKDQYPTSSEVKAINDTRTKVVSYIGNFLDDLGFLKVDSPILTLVSGGADTYPSVTLYNDLNMKMFMEIAPELYLKQFVLGGKERVYEVGQQFRNDRTGLIRCPEFMCQFYMVLADYDYLMELTEQTLSGMVKELTGGYKVAYHANGYDKDPIEIDFTPPFRRLSVIKELEKMANLSIPKDLASEEARQYLADACTKFDINCSPPQTTARLLEQLVRHFLEDSCINPTFIIEHPKIMSPRAKALTLKSGLAERFQLFINKLELINSYTEENDPLVHGKRFEIQGKDQQSGDGETVLGLALDYGLPPTGGWVLRIDRLTMLLTDLQIIKTGSYTFPIMEPQLHHEHTVNDN